MPKKTEIQVQPNLNPKQRDALAVLTNHSNGINEVLYGGAAGGGKTRLGVMWLVSNCMKYPGTRHLIGGKILKKIKQTTLQTFFEVAKDWNLVEGHHFKYSDLRGEIKFLQTNSMILLMDLDDKPQDPEFNYLGSLELNSAYLEEAGQVSEKAKNMLITRIRHKLSDFCQCGFPTLNSKVIQQNKVGKPIKWLCRQCNKETTGLQPKLLMGTNPNRGWTYNEFYKKHVDGTLEPFKKFIQSKVTDNQFISKHYIQSLERQDGITQSRLLHGNWDYQDDLSMFDQDALLAMFQDEFSELSAGPGQDFTPLEEREKGPWQEEIRLSCDIARMGKDRSVFIVWQGFDIIEIKDVHKFKINEQVDYIKDLQRKYGISNNRVIIDSDGVGGGVADYISGCVAINNGARPIDGENYFNLKTQLYFKLAQQVNSYQIRIRKIHPEMKVKLIQELQILKRVKMDFDGKIQMTSKDEVKKQIGRSPDISDAMAYRMYWIVKSSTWDYWFGVAD